MIGYDAGKQLKDAIKAGIVAGAISQDPVGIGYKCVEAAVKAIKGETVPKIIDTGYKWYDKTNIDAPEIVAAAVRLSLIGQAGEVGAEKGSSFLVARITSNIRAAPLLASVLHVISTHSKF